MSGTPHLQLVPASGEMGEGGGRIALLVAGGTGGHLFPAEALAGELRRRGWTVDLATDERGDRYGFKFPARAIHIVPSDTIRAKDPLSLGRTMLTLGRGILKARSVLKAIKPAVVVGFGGYPSFPPLVAANMLKIPSVLHEQNAVMGRANRRLAARVDAVALSFAGTVHAGDFAAKSHHVGVPVRGPVLAAAAKAYTPPELAGPLELLVFGGSQGARVFADLVPPALDLIDPRLRARLHLTQQVREEDLPRVRQAYASLSIKADLAPFFQNLPQRIAASHLVVARSGASTVAELAVIGRPSLLVPLPHAIDNDQLKNAEALAKAGGAVVAEQKTLTPRALAALLEQILGDPAKLRDMAAAAKGVGMPDAVVLLADVVERAAGA